MLKRTISWFVVMILCLSLGASALAQDLDLGLAPKGHLEKELIELVPSPQETLTRGGFATMLTYAASIKGKGLEKGEELPKDLDPEDPGAKAIMALLDEGIMRGVSTSELVVDADSPIIGLHAMILVARTLGLPEDSDIPTLLAGEGISVQDLGLDVDITPTKAARLLDDVFGSHQGIKGYMDGVSEKNAQVQTVRMKSQMTVKMDGTGFEGAMELPITIPAISESAISMKSKVLHQIIQMDMSAMEAEAGQMIMEQYIDDEYIYTLLPDEGWMRMENPMSQVFDEDFMARQLEVSQGLEDSIYYRLLGEEEIDGKATYKIAFYSRAGEISKIISQLGTDLDPEMLELMEESSDLIDSMGARGVQWIGLEDGLVYRADMYMTLAMSADEMGTMTMEVDMKAHYYDYDADIEVAVPQEAKEAKTLEEIIEEMDLQLEEVPQE